MQSHPLVVLTQMILNQNNQTLSYHVQQTYPVGAASKAFYTDNEYLALKSIITPAQKRYTRKAN